MENMQIFEIQTQVLKVHENLTFIVSWVIGTSIFISILLCLKKIDGLEKKKGKADTQSWILYSQLKKYHFCAMLMVLHLLWVCCSLDLDTRPYYNA